MTTKLVSTFHLFQQKVEDYKQLVKFRLTLLVVFTAQVGYLLAALQSHLPINWWEFLIVSLGGFCITGAANTLNQVIERDSDKLMVRTAKRPLAEGRMTVNEAVLFAGLMSVAGIFLLASLNALAATIGTISLMSYAFIYTPLKKISAIAVLVGAFPGAFPPLIGWVACTANLDWEAVLLFTIQFFWQFPHFWAIGWLGFDDYNKAGINLLPSGKKDKHTTFQALLYTTILIPTGVMPAIMGFASIYAGLGLMACGLMFTYYAWQFHRTCSNVAAKHLLFSSFLYLPAALIVLLIDVLF